MKSFVVMPLTTMKRLRRAAALSGALALLSAAPLWAQVPLTLFNGTSLLGWNPHGQWTATAGILGTSGSQPRAIFSAVPFGDYSLSFEYSEEAPTGAKLRLGTSREGSGGVSVMLDGTTPGIGGIQGEPPSHVAITFGANTWHRVQVDAANGQMSVHVDGSPSGTTSRSGAGHVGWEVTGYGILQIRNVKLVPVGLTSAFNNVDLSSWKSIEYKPESSKGFGHDLTKAVTIGFGAKNAKPHSAKWGVQAGAIHGESGPGGLEFTTPIDDALIQITASLKGSPKPDHFVGIGLRNAPGQLSGGYLVGIGPFSGSIDNLAKHAIVNGPSADETIIIGQRTIAIWISGILQTVYTDSRPEAGRVDQGARTVAGTATLSLADDVQLDVRSISITPLAKSGTTLANNKTPATAGPGSGQTSGGTSTAVAPGAPSAAETTLLAQQQAAAKQAEDDRQNKQRIASLMSLALSSSDPQKQVDYYGQVIAIDPSNAPAVQGYKDAQTKLQANQPAQDQKVATEVIVQHDALTKDQQVSDSLLKAQSAFLGGHVAEASSALVVAERLAPDNPLVRDLRSRINATSSLHSRLFYLLSGAGLLTLLGLIAAWFTRKRQQRFPSLEVTEGLDAGKRFPIEKDLVRIGAVAQDGGQKNDIVLQDVDRAISRFHCEIRKQNGQLYLTDLKSSNGTKIDGIAVEPGRPTLLKKNALILLADSVALRFGYDSRKKA